MKEKQNGRRDTMKLWIALKCYRNLPVFVSPASEESLHEIKQKFPPVYVKFLFNNKKSVKLNRSFPQYTLNSYSIIKS